MNIPQLVRRYSSFSKADRAFYLRRFVDLVFLHRNGFAQFGEDLNVMEYFRTFGQQRITYLDLGANHPVIHSNTYLFYRYGSAGVLVDAHPVMCQKLRRKRPRDTVLECGVTALGGGSMKLHMMDVEGLSSFDETWTNRIVNDRYAKQAGYIEVNLKGINDILNEYFPTGAIDFASVDIEGMDYEVLAAWDFDKWRPSLLCIETGLLTRGDYRKEEKFDVLMSTRNYRPLFQTFSNTIFVDERSE